MAECPIAVLLPGFWIYVLLQKKAAPNRLALNVGATNFHSVRFQRIVRSPSRIPMYAPVTAIPI